MVAEAGGPDQPHIHEGPAAAIATFRATADGFIRSDADRPRTLRSLAAAQERGALTPAQLAATLHELGTRWDPDHTRFLLVAAAGRIHQERRRLDRAALAAELGISEARVKRWLHAAHLTMAALKNEPF